MIPAKRIGIFGGTFNPVHNGHVILAENFKNALSLDEIIVIPTNLPPHKSSHNIVSSNDRINMLKLAFKDKDYVSISDIEIRRGGKSYTLDTLNEINAKRPNDKLFILIGSDMFLCFDKWYKYDKIMELATVCAAPRDINEFYKMLEFQKCIDKDLKSTAVMDFPVFSVSSTQIRNAIKIKSNIENLIPEKVYEYILSKGLYEND